MRMILQILFNLTETGTFYNVQISAPCVHKSNEDEQWQEERDFFFGLLTLVLCAPGVKTFEFSRTTYQQLAVHYYKMMSERLAGALKTYITKHQMTLVNNVRNNYEEFVCGA
ncbi:hypothetical protein JCM3774_006778 [Rhodotorula dairenensis]